MPPTRPIKRVFDVGERRTVTTVIHPDGVVTFRLKHKRQVYEAHIRSLFLRAVQNFVEDEKRRRKAERQARHAAH